MTRYRSECPMELVFFPEIQPVSWRPVPPRNFLSGIDPLSESRPDHTDIPENQKLFPTLWI